MTSDPPSPYGSVGRLRFQGWAGSTGRPAGVHPGSYPRSSMRCLRLEWHRQGSSSHRDWKGPSKKVAGSSFVLGSTWSHTVARVIRPAARHMRQVGSSVSCFRRVRSQRAVLYRRRHAWASVLRASGRPPGRLKLLGMRETPVAFAVWYGVALRGLPRNVQNAARQGEATGPRSMLAGVWCCDRV